MTDASPGPVSAPRSRSRYPHVRGHRPEVTLPVTGYLELSDDLIYRSELTITNHRDVAQYVMIELVDNGHFDHVRGFQLLPRETKFLSDGGFATGGGMANRIAAMRIRAVHELEAMVSDSQGMIEANAFVVLRGSRSRASRPASTTRKKQCSSACVTRLVPSRDVLLQALICYVT